MDLPADHRDKLPGFGSEACDRHADPVSMDRKARERPESPPDVHFARRHHRQNPLANFVIGVGGSSIRLLNLPRLDRVVVEFVPMSLLQGRTREGQIR